MYSSAIKDSVWSSTQSRKNKRYSNTDKLDESLHESNFRLMDDVNDSNLYDQIHKSIIKIDEDESGMTYIEGTNGRKISIFGLKSPIRNSILGRCKESDDKATYQTSTVCSNTINKSSKKSRLKFSSDFFEFGDDEVNQERNNKNREILNLLSESDFEQIRRGIENDYQKASKELSRSKRSDKQPFSSWVEDPEAEENNSH